MSNLESKLKNTVRNSIAGISLAAALSLPGCNYFNPDYYSLKNHVHMQLNTPRNKSTVSHYGSPSHELEYTDIIIEFYKDKKPIDAKVYVLEEDNCNYLKDAWHYKNLTQTGEIFERNDILYGYFTKTKDGWIIRGPLRTIDDKEEKAKMLIKFGKLRR